MRGAGHWRAVSSVLGALVVLALLPVDGQAQLIKPAPRTQPQQPFRVYGNTYDVGTAELSYIMKVSDQGLVLIDGGLAESAPQIVAHIRALGFRPEDIKLILNSHAHLDHAGGLAELQRLNHAKVALSPWSARLLTRGRDLPDDPQIHASAPIAPLSHIQEISDGQTIRVGSLALTAQFTPGHTPGGTSWTWQSCEKARCLHIVYADSLTSVSDDGYRFTDHPDLLRGFDKSFATLNALPCDILLTPHPGFSNMFERLKARDGGKPDAFIDTGACRTFATSSQQALAKRLAQEKTGHR